MLGNMISLRRGFAKNAGDAVDPSIRNGCLFAVAPALGGFRGNGSSENAYPDISKTARLDANGLATGTQVAIADSAGPYLTESTGKWGRALEQSSTLDGFTLGRVVLPGKFTVTCALEISGNASGNEMLIARYKPTATHREWFFRTIENHVELGFYGSNTASSYYLRRSVNALAKGSYVLTATFDHSPSAQEDKIRLFVNGREVSGYTFVELGNPNVHDVLTSGSLYLNNHGDFTGGASPSKVALWMGHNRILSDGEIKKVGLDPLGGWRRRNVLRVFVPAAIEGGSEGAAIYQHFQRMGVYAPNRF